MIEITYSSGSIAVPAVGSIIDVKMRDTASVLFAPNKIDIMTWSSTNFDVNNCIIDLYRGPTASGLKLGTIKLGTDGKFDFAYQHDGQGNRYPDIAAGTAKAAIFPLYMTIYSGKGTASTFNWVCRHT